MVDCVYFYPAKFTTNPFSSDTSPCLCITCNDIRAYGIIINYVRNSVLFRPLWYDKKFKVLMDATMYNPYDPANANYEEACRNNEYDLIIIKRSILKFMFSKLDTEHTNYFRLGWFKTLHVNRKELQFTEPYNATDYLRLAHMLRSLILTHMMCE